ncbi:MAG: EF-hand domain-containing protein [Pseudomonadales bacterium]
MKTRNIAMIAGALTLTAVAWQVVAEPGARHQGPHGKFPINISEAEQRSEARFATLDADNDGVVSDAEFKSSANDSAGHRAHHRGWKGKMFHEGRMRHRNLSDEEKQERRAAHQQRKAQFEEKLFDLMDEDGNGQLSREEASAENRRTAKHQLFKSHAFDRLDADDSGAIDRTEFAVRIERLKAADANADGLVSRDELRNMRHARPDIDA